MDTWGQKTAVFPNTLVIRVNHSLMRGPISSLLTGYLHLLNQTLPTAEVPSDRPPVPVTINLGVNRTPGTYEITRGRLYIYWWNLPMSPEVPGEASRSLSLFKVLSEAYGEIYLWTKFPPTYGQPGTGWLGWNPGQRERFCTTYTQDVLRRLRIETPEFYSRLGQELELWGGSLWQFE